MIMSQIPIVPIYNYSSFFTTFAEPSWGRKPFKLHEEKKKKITELGASTLPSKGETQKLWRQKSFCLGLFTFCICCHFHTFPT